MIISNISNTSISRREFLGTALNGALGLASTTISLSASPASLFGTPRPFNPNSLNLSTTSYKLVKSGKKQYPIVWLWLGGGFSHLDTFCLNNKAPEGIRTLYEPISTNDPGLKISEKLPRTARIIHKTALLRNIYHTQGDHELAVQRIFTSSDEKLNEKPRYLPYVVRLQQHLGNDNLGYSIFQVSGFTYEGIGPNDGLKIIKNNLPNSDDMPFISPAGAEFDRQRHRGRMSLQEQINKGNKLTSPQIQKMEQHYQTADKIFDGPINNAFDLSKVDPRVRDRYGRSDIGNAALITKRMVEAGTPQVLINHGGWDDHSHINESLDTKLPVLDLALSALLKDLLDQAIIVVGSEFGRTPKINGLQGRDHWPFSNFMIIAGPSVTPRVVGNIDNYGHIIGPDGKYQAEYIGATVFKAAGYELVEERNGLSTKEKMSYYPIFD